MKNLNGTSKTITGIATKNVSYNIMANLYLGMVYDEKSCLANKWTTASWRRNGKCVNRNRPELDLV
jgi:hypothetical protein